MSLSKRIMDDLKTAMKHRQKDRLRVLRSLKAKLLEKEISEREGARASLNDEQTVEVLMKAAKQRKESIDQFEQGGRSELADKEKKELKIIEEYLPEMISEEELRDIVRKKIDKMNAESMDDMGRVMGALTAELKGRAEGAKISKVVKEELS